MKSTLDRRTVLASSLGGLTTVLLGCRRSGVLLEGERVIIVGAGPAGMTAAYQLVQAGADVTVLEATSAPGGRIRHTRDFADFPISLGGEWLHVAPGILEDVVNDPSIPVTTRLEDYERKDSYGFFDGNALTLSSGSRSRDLKFVGSSWLDFFETYVLPSISSLIETERPVARVDWSGASVVLEGVNGEQWEADRVIVTVPLALLQRGDLTFSPPLPTERTDAIAEATIWGGIKIFLAFSEEFYPTFLEFPDSGTDAGQRLYYDAAYGQITKMNILGLFAVGDQAEPYQMRKGEERLQYVLDELDAIFDGAASRTYLRHVDQNWNEEPFARGAYLADGSRTRTSRVLSAPLGDRVFFAGDAYTRFADWSSVHAACWSAIDAVDELVGTRAR
ncbi:MAG: FAD-dependent oxidoreductase [Myxococcota bacterium]